MEDFDRQTIHADSHGKESGPLTTEALVTLGTDFDTEKRARGKIWAKREKQIERVVKNMSRMYGILRGIVGSTLPDLKILELKALKGVEDR